MPAGVMCTYAHTKKMRNSTMYMHMCRTMESGRSSACRLAALVVGLYSGIIGTIPSVSAIESADESDQGTGRATGLY